jgi:hypothetical protein
VARATTLAPGSWALLDLLFGVCLLTSRPPSPTGGTPMGRTSHAGVRASGKHAAVAAHINPTARQGRRERSARPPAKWVGE